MVRSQVVCRSRPFQTENGQGCASRYGSKKQRNQIPVDESVPEMKHPPREETSVAAGSQTDTALHKLGDGRWIAIVPFMTYRTVIGDSIEEKACQWPEERRVLSANPLETVFRTRSASAAASAAGAGDSGPPGREARRKLPNRKGSGGTRRPPGPLASPTSPAARAPRVRRSAVREGLPPTASQEALYRLDEPGDFDLDGDPYNVPAHLVIGVN